MERFTCDWIFKILVVLCDGKVVCGCADPRGERPLGNLADQSIYGIWNSEKVKEIRDGLNRGYSEFCLQCGLKQRLQPGEPVPQHSVEQESLPRIFLEPTVLCNLSCFQAVCSRSTDIVQTRSRPYFPFAAYQQLLKEIGTRLIRLDFFNYGEPFLHPEAVDMIEFTKRNYPNIYLYVSTNGLMLSPEKSERIIRSGLDEITFSIDGTDQETYEKYRCGGDFQKVLSNVSDMVRIRSRLGADLPFINWRYILFKWNDRSRQMKRARKLAAGIGVDRLTWEITDHPRSAISEKYQIGTASWAKIRNEIWDTSQLSNAIPGKKARADIKTVRGDIVVSCGEAVHIPLIVKNTGGLTWSPATRSGKRIFRLGVQLFDSKRVLIDLNFLRIELPGSIEKNQKTKLRAVLPGTLEKGVYNLKFDMVCEGVDWFESAGSPVLWKTIRVV